MADRELEQASELLDTSQEVKRAVEASTEQVLTNQTQTAEHDEDLARGHVQRATIAQQNGVEQ